jgi:alpha-1,2-mannosyltransferase
MSRGAKIILGVVLLLCFSQFTRSIDFKGYLEQATRSLGSGFREIPYPVGQGHFGDFFQSPVVLILLSPFSYLPLFWAKLLYALLSTGAVVWAWRRTVVGTVGTSLAFFLALVFAHPLSDVYLSANINFFMLCLMLASASLLETDRTYFQWMGGALLALAILVKLQPAIFLLWFALRGETRKISWTLAGIVAWLGLTALFLPADKFEGWWVGWRHAVGLYHQAAYAGAVSYQSPPAAFFRALVNWSGFAYEKAWMWTGIFSAAVQGALFFAAWLADRRGAERKVTFAILLSSFFLGVPFSWAQTVLFAFPLVYLAVRDGIGRGPWIAAAVLAAIPKALWPEKIWQQIAEGNLPALCLTVLCAISLSRLIPRQPLPSFHSSTPAPAQNS